MELSDAIKQRRSIRRYKQQPVAEADIKILLEAARFAPSVGNGQPVRFLVVQTPELAEKVFAQTAWGGHVKPNLNPVWGESDPQHFIGVTAKN